MTERIRFVGSLTRDAMAAVIKAADIFVYNTAYEGLSHQLLEVMDIGTPMITTNIGGNPELITNGVEGILVSVNDLAAFDAAVSKLVTNTSLGQRYVTAAKQRVALFKSDTVIEQMAVILKKQF